QQAGAQGNTVVREEHLVLQVDTRDGPRTGVFTIHLVDDGTGDYPTRAAAAAASIQSRFPGAITAPQGGIGIESALSGFSWPAHPTTWFYNAAQQPAAAPGAGSAIVSASGAWNGAGGANWSYTFGGNTASSTGACQGAGI